MDLPATSTGVPRASIPVGAPTKSSAPALPRPAGAWHAACTASPVTTTLRRRDRGMSLVEIMIALVVVAVAMLALASLITSSSRVAEESQYRTFAYNAARRVVEEMRGVAFSEIYMRYNASTSDNPPGTCPGNTFVVDDLPNGPAGSTTQGTLFFPENTAGTLTETPSDALLAKDFGMPKDLNRNGAIDGAVGAYYLLPVKVVVEWLMPGGKTSKVEVVTFITER